MGKGGLAWFRCTTRFLSKLLPAFPAVEAYDVLMGNILSSHIGLRGLILIFVLLAVMATLCGSAMFSFGAVAGLAATA